MLHTNEKIRKIRPKYKKQACVQDLDLTELKAFIGLLFYTAIFKENHEHYTSWYSTDGTGREIYRCIMSKNRLEVLLNTIRFDDADTREERLELDLSAPISELFQSFINKCQDVYSVGPCACVDEMLVAFCGRCKFKMFMPKKPAKYGLKIMCITDATNGYLQLTLMPTYTSAKILTDKHWLKNKGDYLNRLRLFCALFPQLRTPKGT